MLNFKFSQNNKTKTKIKIELGMKPKHVSEVDLVVRARKEIISFVLILKSSKISLFTGI